MPENQITIQKRKNFKFGALLVAMTVITVTLSTSAQAQVVKGTGTPSTIPVWGSGSTIGNSIVSQSGGNIDVNGGVKASGQVTAPSFSGTFSGNGAALSNVNASMLGGLGPGGFAQLGNSNTFSADQTIDGNLDLTGYLNHSLLLQGNVTDSSGDTSANVIGGFGGNNTVPANSVTGGVTGATIAGGGGLWNGTNLANSVTVDFGTVGGGAGNTAGGRFDTVSGGISNTANGFIGSVVGGGEFNASSGLNSTVSGGFGNVASGIGSAVPGGYDNVAAGYDSFAAGQGANVKSNGSFVWSDYSGQPLTDFGPNTFSARASGGFAFYTGGSSGTYLPAGSGSWASLSDRNVKANLMTVDGHAILERLASLPIATWNYKTQSDSVRHMGPMAQDFREAFGLGEDETHISTVDSEGVALAAIQALYQEKQREVRQLQDWLAALESRLATLESSR